MATIEHVPSPQGQLLAVAFQATHGTEEGADDNDQASAAEWAASVRESRLENEGLRRQLEVAMRENDELRERLRHAEGALSSQTAEVL